MEISVNRNIKSVHRKTKQLKNNKYYCPIYKEKIRCFCKEFVEQEKDGFCRYGLYYKKLTTL